MTFIANIVCSSVLWRGLKIRSNGESRGRGDKRRVGERAQSSWPGIIFPAVCDNIDPLAGVCRIHPELSLFMVAEDKD